MNHAVYVNKISFGRITPAYRLKPNKTAVSFQDSQDQCLLVSCCVVVLRRTSKQCGSSRPAEKRCRFDRDPMIGTRLPTKEVQNSTHLAFLLSRQLMNTPVYFPRLEFTKEGNNRLQTPLHLKSERKVRNILR